MPVQKRQSTFNASIPTVLRDTGLKNVHLKIGEGIVTSSDLLISTVLGSCVSVSFFHARTGLAGIFHAMLPRQAGFTKLVNSPCKFVDSAIILIHEQFVRRGIPDKEIVLKLFGGAFSLGQPAAKGTIALVDVGSRNVQVARDELERMRLSLAGENVLGDRGRKLVFNTQTGEVWVKLLGKAEEQAVIKEESVLVPVAEGRACRLGS